MLKRILLATALIATFAVSFSNPAQAVTASDWDAGNIIDDATFTDKDAMSVQEIQTFLNQKVGTSGAGRTPGQCDTNGQGRSELGGGTRAQYGAATGNPAPFTCLKDYYEVPKTEPGPGLPQSNYGGAPIPAGSKSAAQLIWDAAQRYNISPKVLLVKIHTESAGPITTDDWPTIRQYYYAMGSHCPDSGPNGSANCDSNYAGFSIQISSAAALMRSYLNNMRQSWWSNKKPEKVNNILWNVVETGCGGSNVYIQNSATAALYTYTPYQPNQASLNNMNGTGDGCSSYGNRNFWRIFNDWFGKTKGTYLLQSPRGSTVYLQSGSKRFAIPTGDVLWAYGLNKTAVTPVTDAYIDSLSDGGVLGNLFKIEGDPTVYLADNGYRFGIASTALCDDWGLPNCTSDQTTKTLNAIIGSKVLPAGDLKHLSLNGSTVYLMSQGNKLPFSSTKAITENGHSASAYTPITNPINFNQPFGVSLPENNSFVQLNSGAIYAYNNKKFYLATDFNSFKSWYSASSNLYIDRNSAYNKTPPLTNGNLSSYIFLNTGKKYFMDSGFKIDITQSSQDYPDQMNFNDLEVLIDRIPNIANMQNPIYRTSDGMIFRISNKNILPFNSLDDYFQSGYTESNIINISDNLIKNTTLGLTLFASGNGSLFKSSAQGQENLIFTATSLGTSCQLSSLSQLGQFRLNSSYVPRVNIQTSESMAVKGMLTGLVKSESGQLYVVDSNGSKSTLNQQVANSWGLDVSLACVFSNSFLNKIPNSGKSVNTFLGSTDGTIYYSESGKKRPITSFQKYLNLGGTGSNTITVTQDVLNLITTGQPY
jgi:hypothetical protein